MKKQVAVIYGGNSSEYEISILSGRYVASAIDHDKYDVYEVLLKGLDWSVVQWDGDKMQKISQVDKGDFSFIAPETGEKVKFDVAYPVIHGTPGENGLLQGYLEMIGVPFTTCSAFVCTVAFSKYSCKTFLRDSGIMMAQEAFIRKGDAFDPDAIVDKLGLPLFVKPADGGSSFGISKVKKREDLPAAIEEAFKEGEMVIVEEFVAGREMTQGVYSLEDGVHTLPITEIISENEYFDYEAKYLGKSQEVCPAPIDKETADKISAVSKRVFSFMGCSGVIRIDYIINEKGIFFLEINTAPGMTKMSLVPAMVRTAGMDIKDFLTGQIEFAMKREC
ncbi:MAG: D-alanine--D-alanine ligase [Bacteroidales bacterium]|nr:D-alanine--D-alanine ligase [Bacteroidales bacterium]